MIIESFNELKTEIIKTTWKFNNSDQEYILVGDACKNPFCTCTEITFGIGFEKKPPIASFSYDTKSRKILNVGSKDTSELLSKQLISELSENDYTLLDNIFRTTKIKHTNECNLNEVDPPSFPIEEIENKSLMIDFNQIFPWALQHWFEFEGITYLLTEQYCLNTECKCNNVNIDFIAIKDNIHINEKDPTFISYNYITGKWKVSGQGKNGHKGSILIRQMHAKYPDIKGSFADRKVKLKLLYRRYKEKINQIDQDNSTQINVQCGRNDPCYCGSGIKYKKCCGK
jgi:hypothetical protein